MIAIGEIGLIIITVQIIEGIAANEFLLIKSESLMKWDKPVIIHTRSAEDTIAMLREHQAEKCGGLIHCFTETWILRKKKALDLGFIFLVRIITFKNAESIREAIRYVPDEV